MRGAKKTAAFQTAPPSGGLHSRRKKVRPAGFEPATLGSEVRRLKLGGFWSERDSGA